MDEPDADLTDEELEFLRQHVDACHGWSLAADLGAAEVPPPAAEEEPEPWGEAAGPRPAWWTTPARN
ncbi:MAG: hypothetical protein HY319_12835 [Armatimonadetes bacterium]|nr:hypothetical protein [Armatimonadota bacterium]